MPRPILSLRHAAAILTAPLWCASIAILLSWPAAAADPQPYTVDIAPTGNAALDGALKDSSDLNNLQKKAPVGSFALIARSRNDVGRFETALKAYGYYKGHITIQIAGHALDDPGLPALLQDAPADPPTKVTVKATLGPLFHLRHIALQGDVPTGSVDKLGLHTGDPALAAPVLGAATKLLDSLREDGHALAKVDDPVATEDDAANVLDVSYKVAAGPRVDIGAITFSGLQSVNPDYLRRRLLLKSGQLYQPSKIEVARQDLSGTGVFSSVQAKNADHLDTDGNMPVDFDFKERPHHVVGFTAAYSTDLGASAAATWTHRNLFGNAEQLNLKAAVIDLGGSSTNGIGYDVDAQLVKPDFLRRDQSLTFNLEGVKQSFEAYDQTALIASATLNRKISDHWSASAGVQAEQEQIGQEGVTRDYTLIGLPLGVKYDSTDSLFAPTHGIRANVTATPTASFGGSGSSGASFFTIVQATGSTYVDFTGNGHSVLALRATAATVQGASTYEIPPDQRLYAGGSNTIRGYAYQSVGPQYPDHNPVGGTQLAAATVELRQHIYGDFGMAVFSDVGEVIGPRGHAYGNEGPDTGGKLAIGAGVGARYATPIGPIRLDVAVPLQRFPGGDSFEMYIGIGEAF